MEAAAAGWWTVVGTWFQPAARPQVSAVELALVVFAAIAVSLPPVSWRYFGLLATVTHELGHAFAALTTGQRLGGIRLRPDHSGTTTSYSRGRLPAAWSTFWGYPVPGLVGAALVSFGFGGWGPAALATGTLILIAALPFIRNGFGFLILAGAAATVLALLLIMPPGLLGHVAIGLGLALLVAAVRDLAKLTNLHVRHRNRLATSDAFLLYRATSVPAPVWIVVFAALVAASWWVAWQPMAAVLDSALGAGLFPA